MMVTVTLPDGSQREYAKGTTLQTAVEQIGRGLARAALAAKVNGQVVDLSATLEQDCTLEVLTFTSEEGRHVFRHSTAHLLAQAVKRLWPSAQLAIGPALEDSFYYDIDTPEPLSAEDLPKIEAEMAKIVAEDLPIERLVLNRDEAKAFFAERGEQYKVELVDDIPEGELITAYKQGEFVDLCAGPHVPSTGRLKQFKLLSVAGAYWRGDQANKQLQRIYGTSFEKKADLERYLFVLEEAKKRDHRKLGRELDYYVFKEEAPGFAFWLPRGHHIYRTLENWSRELQGQRGYEEVSTPWIFGSKLYERSGHWYHYRENMFTIESEGQDFATKPMNCPGHCLIFRNEGRSYRDLPIKIAEYGPLSRYESSGTLHGLMRVRGLHQDDAHIFCREDQIEDQIVEVIQLVDELYGAFGMTYEVKLSTRPFDDFLGDVALWDRAEASLARALERAGRSYTLNPGDGAFYGPKLDFDVTDALGRKWQCATVQLDFQMPIQFELEYTGEDGQRHRPVMVHRAIMGSIERFVGILMEHFAGVLPAWLMPEQVRLLPIADRHHDYAAQVAAELRSAGLLVEVDDRNEKIGYKIRQAEMAKIPFVLVLGDKEAEAGQVAVRRRGNHDLGTMGLADFTALAVGEVEGKLLDEAAKKAAGQAE